MSIFYFCHNVFFLHICCNWERFICSSFIAISFVQLKGDVLPDDGDMIMDFARSSNNLLQVSTESKLKLFPFLRHLNINVGCHYKTAMASRERLMKRFLHEQKVRLFITLPQHMAFIAQLTLSHIEQFCSRRLQTYFVKNRKSL